MPRNATDAVLKELRAFGLGFPGAHTKSPWPGHMDLAVKDKTFAYLSVEGQPFSISCKLPQSAAEALMLPFTTPTGYGLGKSGWVTAEFAAGETPPVPLLKAWIDESYRAQAPKRLVAQLGEPVDKTPPRESPGGVAKGASARKAAGKPTAPRKAAGKPTAPRKAAGKPTPARKAAGKPTRARKPAPARKRP